MTTKLKNRRRTAQCKRRIDQMRLIQKGVINTKQPKQHVKKLKSLALLWFSYYFTTIAL